MVNKRLQHAVINVKSFFVKTIQKTKGNKVSSKFVKPISFLVKKVLFFSFSFVKNFYDKIKILLENNKELKNRLVYGIIFVVCLLFLLICGGLVYTIAALVLFIIMSYELLKMASRIEQSNNRMFIKIRGFGLIYIAICCLSLILIRETSQGLRISFWMFLTIWSVDSFAYIFGKKFGKIKLAPDISPNKTYEGAIFGTIGGIFVSMMLYRMFALHDKNGFSILSFLILSIIIIILAQLSDLSESYIKRQCGVKDSGKILPGHGGLLDRFDSLLLVSPFVFIVVWLNDGILF